MDTTILLVFAVVYLGMILGGLPFLSLDRTGIALLGAIALIGAGALSLDEAWQAIHVPTLILLFAFMVVSAQLRLGGFYTWITHRTGKTPCAHRRSGHPGDPGHCLGLAVVATATLKCLVWDCLVYGKARHHLTLNLTTKSRKTRRARRKAKHFVSNSH